MSALAFLTIYLVVGLFAMSVAVALAHFKRRIWLMWGILCLFFPPFLLILILLPRRSGEAPYEKESMRDEYEEQEKKSILFW